jgi:hypothetical protein
MRRSSILAAGMAALLAVLPATPAPAADEAGTLDRMLIWLGWKDAPRKKAPPPPDEGPPPDIFPSFPVLRFQVRDLSVPEGAGRAVLTVARDSAAGESVTVRYATEAGTATAGKDFQAVSGVLEFGPADREKRIEVPILDDSAHEPAEAFAVVLSQPRNAVLDGTAARAAVTVVDDDPAPVAPPPARLSFQPVPLVFPAATVDMEPRRREGAFVNQGGSPAAIERVLAEGGEGAFRVVAGGDECSGRTVAPGGSCSVLLEFVPPAEGTFEGRVTAVGRGLEPASGVLRGSGRLPEIVEDPLAARIAERQAARRAGQGRTGSTEIPPEDAMPPRRYLMRDPDWAEIGVGRTYWSMPVERTRIVTVDRYIPCVLEDTINSQIPGFVHCVIESNVYGSDGRLVLIPKGSRVVGDFQSLGKTGDTRLNVVWRRMFRPDGASILISSGFQTVDIMGRTGLPGTIDNRLWEKYGGALLMTAISVGSALAVPPDGRFANAQGSLADNFGQITTQMLEEKLDLRPVITVPAGSRLNIIPLADLWFPRPDLIAAAPGKK